MGSENDAHAALLLSTTQEFLGLLRNINDLVFAPGGNSNSRLHSQLLPIVIEGEFFAGSSLYCVVGPSCVDSQVRPRRNAPYQGNVYLEYEDVRRRQRV